MAKRRFHIAVVAAVIALVGVVLAVSNTGRGQTQTKVSQQPAVKPVAIVRERTVNAGPFAVAASRNATLRTDLSWVFGGKPQRGWYLYQLLIGETLKTEQGPNTTDFASALASWQQRSGLQSSGVLDDDTLYALVASWQGRRLKDKTPALPEQLVTAPSSDFFDPERVDELRRVERNTYAAYKRLVAAAIADPSLKLVARNMELAPEEKFLKIVSAHRSREYQEKLRRESPHAGSAGLAVNSPHFTGRALDLYVGGEPVETNDPNRSIQVNTPVYRWLVKNAERFGFRPYYYEPWHWEYVGQ